MRIARTLRGAVLSIAAVLVVGCGGGSQSPGAGDGGVSCDPNKVLCKRAEPLCLAGQVPSVEGSCYGPCVPLGDCACGSGDECPAGAGAPRCDALTTMRCALIAP